ncbi:MAG: hypothetical protein ACR2N4_05715 [Jatrophihabitans sp.]
MRLTGQVKAGTHVASPRPTLPSWLARAMFLTVVSAGLWALGCLSPLGSAEAAAPRPVPATAALARLADGQLDRPVGAIKQVAPLLTSTTDGFAQQAHSATKTLPGRTVSGAVSQVRTVTGRLLTAGSNRPKPLPGVPTPSLPGVPTPSLPGQAGPGTTVDASLPGHAAPVADRPVMVGDDPASSWIAPRSARLPAGFPRPVPGLAGSTGSLEPATSDLAGSGASGSGLSSAGGHLEFSLMVADGAMAPPPANHLTLHARPATAPRALASSPPVAPD